MDDNLNKNSELTAKDYKLLAVLAISVIIAILIIKWSREPEYRPLVQDMRLVDAVKIVDALDLEEIPYKADIKNHILYVSEERSDEARIALARVGFAFDYPPASSLSSLPEACEVLKDSATEKPIKPIWEQIWFMRLMKLVMGGLVIIVLIVAVVRPALKSIIYPNDNEL